jgi:excisionase family DNA binding protein
LTTARYEEEFNVANDAQTVLPPSPADRERARVSGSRLAALPPEERVRALRLRAKGKDHVLELPAGAVELLLKMLEQMAAGYPVVFMPQNTELTTQQAADLLNVSRPFLIRLLNDKRLPFRLVGTHRRIRYEDIMAFKDRDEAGRRRLLDELTAEAQELGLGY